nr:unnamed protein product [Digitaria exilis]
MEQHWIPATRKDNGAAGPGGGAGRGRGGGIEGIGASHGWAGAAGGESKFTSGVGARGEDPCLRRAPPLPFVAMDALTPVGGRKGGGGDFGKGMR